MSAPALDLKPWTDISEGLTPLENLGLVGLLILRPQTLPSNVSKSSVLQGENFRSVEGWAKKNFREALRLYCDQIDKSEIKVLVQFVKTFAPFFAAQLSLPIGAAIGFIFWCGGFGLERWCNKYSIKRFSGKGQLLGNNSLGDIEGFFSITYRPPIHELVEDPEAYPVERFKVNIEVPEITNGLVKVPTPNNAEAVYKSFENRVTQSFLFPDDKTRQRISGNMDAIARATNEGPNVLSFSTSALNVQ
jgi:hypothetical protein